MKYLIVFLLPLVVLTGGGIAQYAFGETILVNTTNVNNCVYGNNETNPNDFCAFYTVTGNQTTCKKHFVNLTVTDCPIDGGIQLNTTNFVDGLLLADTKFNNEYLFAANDTIDPDNQLQVGLDFNKHIQDGFEGINSPRIDIKRQDGLGIPNMNAAKSQIITWKGDIKDFFNPIQLDNFNNETYITLQFNTGRHGSEAGMEEFAFGALFDVSGQSNPKLLEFREPDNYVKYDYDIMRQLAGNGFKFHNTNPINGPLYINNLTNTNNVTLKVITKLVLGPEGLDRTIDTFINDKPYWSIDNLSTLIGHEDVENEFGFNAAVKQGSGHVVARTDNIETRLYSFGSQALPITFSPHKPVATDGAITSQEFRPEDDVAN